LSRYEELLANSNNQFAEHEYLLIQKVFASPHYIILSCRSPGKTTFLYVGKGAMFCGVWLSEVNVLSKYRIRDRWNQFFKKNIVGLKVTKTEIVGERIMKLSTNHASILIGYENSLLKIAIGNEDVYALPWGKEVSEKDFIEKECNSKFVNIYEFLCSDYNEDIEGIINKKVESANRKDNKKSNKKSINIKKDIKAIDDALKLWDELIEGNVDLSSEKLSYGKLKIKFNKGQSQESKRNDVLNKLKRFKKGKKILQERLENVKLKDNNEDLSIDLNMMKIEPKWELKKYNIKGKVDTQNFKLFKFEKYTFYKGLDSKSNDYIRSKISKKEDYWFHVDSETSAHIIAKGFAGTPTLELLQIVAGLIIDKLEVGKQISLIYTKCKYLKSVKGHSGSVRFSKEKRITVLIDQELVAKITSISNET
tara:strand:+ start:214828 stop:216093 length:1266 start_codon:yes stop_codon:yes gene_type:complete